MTVTPARALLHFLLLGGAAFAVARWWGDPPRAAPVVLEEAELEALRAEGAVRLGRAPDAAEWGALARARVDEEILLREALARGLDQGDPVVAERMVRNMRFLGEDEGATPEQLLTRARAMGMDRTDPVVRRRLVDRMRAVVEAPARAWEPADAELRAYLEAHPERFAVPRRVAFEHVFFAASRHPDAASAAREALAARPDEAGPGDPFPAPRAQPLQTELSLSRYFGPGFAAALFELPEGHWAGPVSSPDGVHLVRVLEVRAGERPGLAEARAGLVEAMRTERAEAATRDFLARRRQR